jgi:hypothetical protein
MDFTETDKPKKEKKEKKEKKPRAYFIGNPGGYRNVRVPIKNYHTTSIAKRINKNMTSLNIQDQATNKNLDSLLQPVLVNDSNIDDSFLKNEILKSEKASNIFNYSYENVTTSIAEKTKEYENEELKNKLKNIAPVINVNLKFNLSERLSNTLDIMINDNTTLHNLYDNSLEEKPKIQQIDDPLKFLKIANPIIENVYQEKYHNNINATGIGDFIRGSYFLIQFCDNNNIPYNINLLNHPISQFLEIYQNQQPLVYNNIDKFELTNYNPHILDNNIITNIYDYTINDSFVQYLINQSIFKKKLYIYTISYPSAQISQKHKEYMRKILKPSMRLESLVEKMLLDLGLNKKEFTIIHIRYGDDFLIKNKLEIKKSHVEMIENILDNLDLSKKYLLMSDNIVIKNILHSKYPFLKIHLNEISHTGEGLHLETNKLQNTMIDFNLFSHATNIIAFSIYKHGTGFSKWSAETYNVPYICRFLG